MDLISLMKNDFRLSRVYGRDSVDQSNLLSDFRSVILEKEHSYPEIGDWLENQVLPQLGHPNRTAYVAYSDNRPVGAVVFKISSRPKLCHLHISDDVRRQSLGDVLLALMALQVGNLAREVHFTIPESVWEEQKGFFSRFGFRNHGEASRQYRLFDRELYCSAPIAEFSQVALRRLGELTGELHFGPIRQEPSLLLSIRPVFARRILEGKKTIEIRRKFSRRWNGHRIAIYASHPEQSVVGEATIDMIDSDRPEAIWERYASGIRCELNEFLEYCDGSRTLTAIGLRDVSRFDPPLKRSSLVSIFGDPLRPPQSYFLLGDAKPWSSATSIASMLGSHSVASQPLTIRD